MKNTERIQIQVGGTSRVRRGGKSAGRSRPLPEGVRTKLEGRGLVLGVPVSVMTLGGHNFNPMKRALRAASLVSGRSGQLVIHEQNLVPHLH